MVDKDLVFIEIELVLRGIKRRRLWLISVLCLGLKVELLSIRGGFRNLGVRWARRLRG